MGYGTGKKDMPTVNGIAMAGKMHGGGVKLDRKSPGKISDMQDSVLGGEQTKKEDNAMAKSGVISGGHSKGGFMKHSKSSYGHAKAKTMVKGPDGKMVPDYAVDGQGSGDLKKSSPGKYGGNKGDESAETKAEVKAIKKDARKDYMKK